MYFLLTTMSMFDEEFEAASTNFESLIDSDERLNENSSLPVKTTTKQPSVNVVPTKVLPARSNASKSQRTGDKSTASASAIVAAAPATQLSHDKIDNICAALATAFSDDKDEDVMNDLLKQEITLPDGTKKPLLETKYHFKKARSKKAPPRNAQLVQIIARMLLTVPAPVLVASFLPKSTAFVVRAPAPGNFHPSFFKSRREGQHLSRTYFVYSLKSDPRITVPSAPATFRYVDGERAAAPTVPVEAPATPPRNQPPSPFASPGFQLFASQHSISPSLGSRTKVASLQSEHFGERTASLRSAALNSLLADTRASVRPIQAVRPAPRLEVDDTTRKCKEASLLIPLLPHECFVSMAGGQALFDATPEDELKQAAKRTVLEFAGKRGDNAHNLRIFLEELADYMIARGYDGIKFPVGPVTLANFAIHKQECSQRHGATSVAPKVISTFRTARAKLHLPIEVDSPHLSAIPRHQTGGEGYTGHFPLLLTVSIIRAASSAKFTPFRYFCRILTAMLVGGCRSQDWIEVELDTKTLTRLPHAAIVFVIAITKSGEKNTRFALPPFLPFGNNFWPDFAREFSLYGRAPAISGNVASARCTFTGTALPNAAALASIIESLLNHFIPSKPSRVDMHLVPHSAHGSFTAYSEAMGWHFTPQHELGRHAPPLNAPVRAASRRPVTITARYSTFAACERQLFIRERMLRAISSVEAPPDYSPSLACFSACPIFARSSFYGLSGCAPH